MIEMSDLSKQLRRAENFTFDLFRKLHPETRFKPWYIEVYREAADEIERLTALAQNGQSAIDTNRQLAEELEKMRAELERMYERNPCEDCPHLC